MPITNRITFTGTLGSVSIKAGDTVLAHSADAVVLTENGYTPRLYFPIADVNMDVLQVTDTASRCPYKGQAVYYTAQTTEGELNDIAWAYNDPIDEAEEIKGLIAFYQEKLAVSGS
ncbi:DUF427 domain-containing protein [Rhodospirillales bacterium]|nr:DUF427 domain-containing protein [Rhodospirillales bacterium]